VPGTHCLQADVGKSEPWDAIVAFADVVFHLAGNTSVYAAEEDPATSVKSTVLPMVHAVQSARRAGRKPRMVFAGTATQYGLTGPVPVGEETPCRPITHYDLHKVFAEEQLMLASQQGLLEGVSLRLANVYGPSAAGSGSSDRGVINRAAASALAREPLRLFGGGHCLRDYVFIGDVVAAFLAVGSAKRAAGRVFNVGSGLGVTVREAFCQIVREAERFTACKVPLEDAPWPATSHEIERRNFVADTRALQTATGWSPQVRLEDGIARLIRKLAAAG
jgi:nucleoside-diphosphate-sugar epimerase